MSKPVKVFFNEGKQVITKFNAMPFGPELPFDLKNHRQVMLREKIAAFRGALKEKKRKQLFYKSKRYGELQIEAREKRKQAYINAQPLRIFPFLKRQSKQPSARAQYGGYSMPVFDEIKQ